MRTLNFVILIIFAGSVFLTSGKFVNETNAPKLYIVVLIFLVITAFIAISRNYLNFCVIRSKTILWGINIVCILQACYGLFQFVDWNSSHHLKFAVTGCFDNPAGFAAVLSIAFPIGLYLFIKSRSIIKYLIIIGLIIIVSSIILSGSRTGIIAIIISSLIIFVNQTSVLKDIGQLRLKKSFLVLSFILMVVSSIFLYNQKKDSADGRLLIWEVSCEMIKDKPIYGHGFGSFKAKYMDYQAKYFEENPNSKYHLLADNVKHPFNEFILLGVEFGTLGLLLVGLAISIIILRIRNSDNEHRHLALCGIISFLTFASFSYPLQYIAVWLLLAFYVLLLFKGKILEIPRTIFAYSIRFFVVTAAVLFIIITIKQIQSELKWKEIAMNSLRGYTVEMLPEYEKLFPELKTNPLFLYNYGAELNVAGKYDESIAILSECQKRFNDYDLQLLLANNFQKKGESQKAIQIYENASNMVPCRFLPLYQIFEIYKDCGKKDLAVKYANEITNKKVKIPSLTINSIKAEAEEYLKTKDANILTLKQ